MSSVERLIFDVLAHRGSVQLPGVGTLEVMRRKAKRVSESQIMPPVNAVVFSPEGSSEAADGAYSVVDMLNQKEGLSMDDAWATYNAWAAGASQDGAFVIDGVGTVRDGRFEPSEELHGALNPAGDYGDGADTYDEPRRVRRGMPWWAWVLIGLLCLAIVFACLWFCCDGFRDRLCGDGGRRTEVVTPVLPEAVVDTVAVAPLLPEPVGPRFHVIAGAFAEPGNAEKLMDRLRREHPGLTLSKLVQPRTGYELVSIYSSADRAEAFRVLNRSWDVNPCMWVFEAR